MESLAKHLCDLVFWEGALSEPGHRDVVMGAIVMVLEATTLNPTDAFR